MSIDNPVTSSGIKPATFLLPAEFLNERRVPTLYIIAL
jgi:hypothetical protein